MHATQLLDLVEIDILSRQKRGLRFEKNTQFAQLRDLLPSQNRYTRRAIGHGFECPFGDQALQCLTCRHLSDPREFGHHAQ